MGFPNPDELAKCVLSELAPDQPLSVHKICKPLHCAVRGNILGNDIAR